MEEGMKMYIINEYQTTDQGEVNILTPEKRTNYFEAESVFNFKKGFAAISQDRTIPYITITWDDNMGFRVDSKTYGPERFEDGGSE